MLPIYRIVIISLILTVCLSAVAFTADKPDLPAQINAARASIEEIAAKVGNYPQALTEIEKARTAQKKAAQSYEKGRQWMGLGSLKPEAEQEVRHYLLMVEMATTLASSRAAKGRSDEEAAALDKQLAVVKARVKLLEERKAEEERLRQAVQKGESASKELTAAKADIAKLASQNEQISADKKKLEAQLEALTAEKSALAGQLEKLKKSASSATSPTSAEPK